MNGNKDFAIALEDVRRAGEADAECGKEKFVPAWVLNYPDVDAEALGNAYESAYDAATYMSR
jgi:hypothetical protein